MNPQDIIYPSDIKAAREAAIARNPADKNGYSALRINFAGKKEPKGGRVTYYPFEINLADGRGWKKLDKIYFMNLKHVGKVNELSERAKTGGVPDVALLFKDDYTYKRIKTVNGLKSEVVEEYGKEKAWLSRAFVAHVKKHQQKDEFSKTAQIRVNVKHEREVKDPKTGKITREPISPGNINISIPFKGIDGNDALKKDPKTKFQCEILDVERKKPAGSFDPKKEWPFEVAMVRGQVKTDQGMVNTAPEELNNGNIHKFLRGGSECSGFDNMGDVCLSNMGISNPSKVQVLMVKQSLSQAVAPTAISSDDWDMIGGGSTPAQNPATQTVEVPMPDGSFSEVATAVDAEGFEAGDGFDTSAAAGSSETFDF